MVSPQLTVPLRVRVPGMVMGSGATVRLFTTTGSVSSPQFSQANSTSYGTEGQEELEPG